MRAIFAVDDHIAADVRREAPKMAARIGMGEWDVDVVTSVGDLMPLAANDPPPDCTFISLSLDDIVWEKLLDEVVQELDGLVVFLAGEHPVRKAREFLSEAAAAGYGRVVYGQLPGIRPYTVADALREAASEGRLSARGSWLSDGDEEPGTSGEGQRTRARSSTTAIFLSSKGGAGKTTISVTLAMTLAQDMDVCLLDANLINPDCGKHLENRLERPISVGIEGLADLPEITPDVVERFLVKVKGRQLWLLPGPTKEYVGSARVQPRSPTFWEDLLKVLRGMFDVVLVDTFQDFDSAPAQALAPVVGHVYVVLDSTKYNISENVDQAPKLVHMGVRPGNIRIVLNSYDGKIGPREREITRAYHGAFGADQPRDQLPRVAAILRHDYKRYLEAQWQGTSVPDADPEIAQQWDSLVRDLVPTATPRSVQRPKGWRFALGRR